MKHAPILLAGLLLGACAPAPSAVVAEAGPVAVYKSASCACCSDWERHLRRHGFTVEPHETEAVADLKHEHHLDGSLWSCHTAFVDGYLVEGHVPAWSIERLLAEAPDDVLGLAVPGMPLGSPGMEAPGLEQPYDVLLVLADGTTTEVFEHVPAP